METATRGIRGAIRVRSNSRDEILAATAEMPTAIVDANNIKTEDIVSIFLTATPDLNAEFPAYAARQMGWKFVPLMCAQEIAKPGAMDKMIRVLIHVNSDLTQTEIRHQYLGETAKLRPDLTGGNDDDRSNEI